MKKPKDFAEYSTAREAGAWLAAQAALLATDTANRKVKVNLSMTFWYPDEPEPAKPTKSKRKREAE